MPDIAAVILAAGQSQRFGADKLLHPLTLHGVTLPLVVHSLRPWLAVFGRVTVVVRPQSGALRSAVSEACGDAVHWVECADAAQGMGHSLAAGVAAHDHAAGWLIGLADMPALQAESIASVKAAIKAGAALAAPYCNGERGHPVGFGRIYRDDLLALRGDSGGRELLQRDVALIHRIEVADAGIFTDIDHLADLQALTGENQ